MTEKELEKLFRSKLDKREFAFNPANWEAMEAILDSQPKPGGAYYWKSVLAVLLFGISVFGIMQIQPKYDGNENLSTEYKETKLPEIEDSATQIPKANGVNDEVAVHDARSSTVAVETEVQNSVVNTSAADKNPGAQEITNDDQITDNDRDVEEPLIADNNEAGNIESESLVTVKHKGLAFMSNLPQGFMQTTSPGGHFSNEAFNKFDRASSFYLEFAPIFSGAYNADNVGFGWKAGIGWEKSLGQAFQVNIGLGYSVQNGIGIENSSDSVFFNFGREEIQTTEVTNRIDYIELPISLGYKINERNMLQMGVYAGYLVNVSRKVDKEITQFKSGTSYESQVKNGYQDEFRRLDFGFDVGYRYRLSPALSVGLHYNLGVVDITKDVQGDYLKRHTNQNTRVVFRYRFL